MSEPINPMHPTATRAGARLSVGDLYRKTMAEADVDMARFGARLFFGGSLAFFFVGGLTFLGVTDSIFPFAFLAWLVAGAGMVCALLDGKCPKCEKSFLLTPLSLSGSFNLWKLIFGRGSIRCGECGCVLQ